MPIQFIFTGFRSNEKKGRTDTSEIQGYKHTEKKKKKTDATSRVHFLRQIKTTQVEQNHIKIEWKHVKKRTVTEHAPQQIVRWRADLETDFHMQVHTTGLETAST